MIVSRLGPRLSLFSHHATIPLRNRMSDTPILGCLLERITSSRSADEARKIVGRKVRGFPMNMPIQPVQIPLFDDGQGGLRVSGTRVLLERIVHAFEDGATPEGIVQSYDTLQLADVYAVLTWYLQHKGDV